MRRCFLPVFGLFLGIPALASAQGVPAARTTGGQAGRDADMQPRLERRAACPALPARVVRSSGPAERDSRIGLVAERVAASVVAQSPGAPGTAARDGWRPGVPVPSPSARAVPQPASLPATFRSAVDVVAGYAGFLDESLVDHTIVGATFRYRVRPGVSIGPEIVYMVGPGTDRDLFVTGNAIFDFLLPADGPRPGTFNPFLVVGGGFMVHRSRFGNAGFSVAEGALTGGAGVRVWISQRVYALGEYRVGWEPHIRVNGGIGVAW